LLRRYRNGTFLFQRRYLDDRLTDFMKPGTVAWIRSLRNAFSRWFPAYIHDEGEGKR
jgi:hypothetical protein